MPSKGLSVYSYISPRFAVDEYLVEFSVPGPNGTITNSQADNFTVKSLEIESKHLPGLTNFVGEFRWRVLQHGTEIAGAWNKINVLTGNLAGGGMIATQHFAPFVLDDALITYGFYDAGSGKNTGLTNRHQCYVTLVPRHIQSWMGQLAPPNSPAAQLPFSRFVLPAPHDNGMNSMQNADAVLNGISASDVPYVKDLLPYVDFFDDLPDTAVAHMLPNIVYGISVTQKKSITTMLELGARYFEFRPAKLLPLFQAVSDLDKDQHYFHHACIPGIALDNFLTEQVRFLSSHPEEIVVIHIRYDNIPDGCEKPLEQELWSILTTACSQSTGAIPLRFGGRECFSESIDALRSSGRRIILVHMVEKYDSWTAAAYATLHSTPIIARFESMHTEGQLSTDLTILQCQATSQSIKEVLVYSVLASNAATSCLMSTKAMGDMRTLPWIRDNVLHRLQAERNVVVMNDFIDGATCELCVELSSERLKVPPDGYVK